MSGFGVENRHVKRTQRLAVLLSSELAALSAPKDAQFRPFISSTHAPIRVQRRRYLVPITIPASQPGRPPTRLPGCPLFLGHPLPVIEGIITACRTPCSTRMLACTKHDHELTLFVGICKEPQSGRDAPAPGDPM